MKIAAVSEDAPFYVVLTLEGDKVVSTEVRNKAGHQQFVSEEHEPEEAGRHGYGPQADSRHARMINGIADCEVLLAGGMGWGAYQSLQARGIKPFITDVRDIQEAARLYAQGKLPNLQERLH